MSKMITQRELRNDSAAVLREVQRGASFVVSRNGVPVAELRPLAARTFVPREELRQAQRTAPRVDLSRFRADLDAITEQSIDE